MPRSRRPGPGLKRFLTTAPARLRYDGAMTQATPTADAAGVPTRPASDDGRRAASALGMAIALNADGGAPDWIHIMPAGPEITGRDGRAWRLEDAAAVVAASMADGAELLVDIDHAADRGRETRAAGWVKELQARPDGIWARVAWTDAGRQAVMAREYRFVSPVFFHSRDDASKTIRRVGGVSLTNKPNLDLKSLNREGETAVDELMKALCAALGLEPAKTKPEDAVEAVTRLKADRDRAASTVKAVAAAAGAAEDADEKTVLAAIEQSKAAGQPDPARHAPVAVVHELQKELNTLKSAIAEEKAVAAVDAAIKDGRLAPAQRDWAVGYAKADPDGFAAFCGQQPVIVGGRVAPRGQDGAPALTPEEKEICAALALDEATYVKTRAAQAKAREEAA